MRSCRRDESAGHLFAVADCDPFCLTASRNSTSAVPPGRTIKGRGAGVWCSVGFGGHAMLGSPPLIVLLSDQLNGQELRNVNREPCRCQSASEQAGRPG